MDKFYIIVIVVAVICLILCLVAVGLTLQSASVKTPFPKLQAPCPDGWGMDGSGCTVNALNIGTIQPKNVGGSVYDISGAIWKSVGTAFQVKEHTSICEKKKWAFQNGVTWDGVSNYNQCK